MKKQIFFACVIAVFLSSVFFTACKKENGKDNDLTETVVGKYTNPNDYDLEIVVNKIDNSTVSITLQNGYFDYAFTNVKMNTATSFTLNQYTKNSYCYSQISPEEATLTISGTGTASNNNISLFISENTAGNTGTCSDSDSYTFSASK